jgi:hypothetical protein
MEALQVHIDPVVKPFSELRPIEGMPHGEGADKVVYKVSDGQRLIAAKIFRDRDAVEGEEINKPERAQEEIEAYRKFRKTSLGVYIPEPYYLIQDDDRSIIGLAVEWRDGIDLSYRAPEKPLLQAEFDQFATALQSLTADDPIPDQDMYMEANVVVDDSPSSPDRKIWLAECALATDKDDIMQHPRRLGQTLRYLEKNYVVR